MFITGDVRGYVGPCGCSENMRGGLPRLGHQISVAKKAGLPTALLDSGDSLFRYPKPTDAQLPQEERKAKAIAEAFRKAGLVARGVGELDQVRGDSFLAGLGLPTVARGAAVVTALGALKLGATSASTVEELRSGSKAARDLGASFVVGLIQGPSALAQQLGAQDVGADLLVVGHGENEFDNEDNRLIRTVVPVAQVQSKGRSVGRVDLKFTGASAGRFELSKGEADKERELSALDQRIELLRAQVNDPSLQPAAMTLRKDKLEELLKRREALSVDKPTMPSGKNAFTVRFIPLETTVPNDPELEKVVSAYDKDVGELNVAWAKANGKDCRKPDKGEAAFIGSAACKECHEESFPVFEASKHAHAYETLVSKNKQFHLDCVGCHVTGWQKPGGVCRIDKVTDRKDVGCESCHGAGSIHAEDPDEKNIRLTVDEPLCVSCHDRENSPHFEFEKYLAQILGKGHDRKKSK